MEVGGAGANRQRAAVWHGVACVDSEVEQDLLYVRVAVALRNDALVDVQVRSEIVRKRSQ